MNTFKMGWSIGWRVCLWFLVLGTVPLALLGIFFSLVKLGDFLPRVISGVVSLSANVYACELSLKAALKKHAFSVPADFLGWTFFWRVFVMTGIGLLLVIGVMVGFNPLERFSGVLRILSIVCILTYAALLYLFVYGKTAEFLMRKLNITKRVK